jgi:tripartite-type tricarboxylate transporter receptor subunit TctC
MLASAMPVSHARAEWQPTKPIEFVVMAGKGGGADKATRFLAELMKAKGVTSQPVNVVNVPGHSGGDALQMLQKRSGDDHLIAFTLNSFYTTPILQPALGVDIAKFSPIARLAEDVFLLWVHKDRTDINTIDDFVAAVKAKGNK